MIVYLVIVPLLVVSFENTGILEPGVLDADAVGVSIFWYDELLHWLFFFGLRRAE